MFFERIESKGIAHYSYLLGDQHDAVVIDPRRDCDVYIEKAYQRGLRIKHILETHRNEDYVVGSCELATRTDAEIWHADTQLNYEYGQPVAEGQTWPVGRLSLRAVSTPGHTPGSMSYVVNDVRGAPWLVFTGDTLFAGDVGRVDLVDRIPPQEMARRLYDSVFNRLLPLGAGVIVLPAHGSGSVCGANIADRVWTTLGIEQQHNPKLQHRSEQQFVEAVANTLERPPYFRTMERRNLTGAPLLKTIRRPQPLPADAFETLMPGSCIVDTRLELGFSSAHVPGALSLWLAGLPSFAGWFIPYEKPLLLVNETDDATEATNMLIRLGYDAHAGFLAGGMLAWHMAGKPSRSIQTVTVSELCHELDQKKEPWILDVRSSEEIHDHGAIPGAHHIHVTQVQYHTDRIPKDRAIHIFCGSGMRSMITASLLQSQGWKNLTVVLGGLAGWHSTSCPLE